MTEEEKRETVNAVMAEIDKRTQRVQDLPESFDLADFNTLPVLNRDGRMSTLNAGQLKGGRGADGGYLPIIVHEADDTTVEIAPNTEHHWKGVVTALTFTLAAATESRIGNEYRLCFKTGDTAPAVTIPTGIKLQYVPRFNKNCYYEITVSYNVECDIYTAVVFEWNL